jgi:long-chain acyl-CoA synthetase
MSKTNDYTKVIETVYKEIEKIFNFIPGVQDSVVYEGKSRRGVEFNATVLEVYPDKDFCAANGIDDVYAYLHRYVDDYNRNAVPYKKIAILKIRDEDFPKNTLRKIQRFKMDTSID